MGPTLLMRLYRHFSSVQVAWDSTPAELLAVEGIGLQTATAIAQARSKMDPEQLLARHAQENPNFWTPADVDYPRLLLEIPDPPPILYYRGQVIAGENQGIIPMIAIVGTRQPSAYGRRWTQRIARTLAKAGFSVVSGLAMGVDAIAHQSCLDMNGRTIAVVGTGVNIVYPWSNRKLAESIIEQGLIVSEYPIGTKPAAPHFPQRNRIIAGLSRATLVLEAPVKSGALITARVANEYGRDVYALPGSLDDPRAEGCLRLMSQGAHTILGEEHLLTMLGAIPTLNAVADMDGNPMTSKISIVPESPAPSVPRGALSHLQGTASRNLDVAEDSKLSAVSSRTPTPSISLEPNTQKVLEAVPLHSPIALDTIVQTCQLPTGDVLASLSELELLGLVLQSAGMMYQRD